MARRSENPGAMLGDADGRQLAVDLLRELRAAWEDESWLIDERTGAQRDNVVLRYLAVLRTQGSPSAEAGFAAVLTDFMGSAVNGGVPDPDLYERTYPQEPTGESSPAGS